MLVEAALSFLFILLYWNWTSKRKGANYKPFPGPWRIPIIGNIHQIAATKENEPFLAMHLVAEKTGSPIVTMQLGQQEIIHLSDYEDIIALLSKEETTDRVFLETIRKRSWNLPLGIIFASGDEWKEVRRFTLRALRDFGFGKRFSMEASMQWEMGILLERLRKQMSQSGGRITVDMLFNHSLMNVSWTMVGGERYSYEDPRMKRLLRVTAIAMKSGSFGTDLGFMFPILIKVLPRLTNEAALNVFFKETQQFFHEVLTEHRKKDYSAESDCVVDAFLCKIDEDRKQGRTVFTEQQVMTVLMDLFLTASDTLGGSLAYALLYMTLNPEVQAKVHEEINSVIPANEEVSLAHKPKMVYTQATLLETLRLGCIAPLIPTRRVNKSFDYKGYHFPKGTSIIGNLYSAFQDPNYFENPRAFNPDRFIDKKGNLFRTERMTLAFGTGKRFCMGEPLAQAALFMFFTTFMKNFAIAQIPNEESPSAESLPAFTRTPKPFDVHLLDRLARNK